MAKNLISGPILVQFSSKPKFEPQTFFSWVLPLQNIRYCRKLSSYSILRKTYDPHLRKWQKKTHFEPHLGLPPIFFIKIVVWKCSKLSSYLIWRKTNKLNLRKWQKKASFGHKFGPQKFLSWLLPLPDVRHCCKLYNCMQSQGRLTNKTW